MTTLTELVEGWQREADRGCNCYYECTCDSRQTVLGDCAAELRAVIGTWTPPPPIPLPVCDVCRALLEVNRCGFCHTSMHNFD